MKQTTTVMQTPFSKFVARLAELSKEFSEDTGFSARVYQIKVQETRVEIVPVIAESLDAAINRVKQAYNREEIVLDTDSFQDITFKQI